uniref:BKRF1 encodes EBNA-1 protein-like n=1 Tax=Oryza glaberrima TaxID=4538 RepID=I1R8Y4_ORYGL
MARTTSPARCCDVRGGAGAADGARVGEGPTGEIPARRMERPARHDGVPAKFGRRRGLAGEEDGVGDGVPVPGEVVATSAGAQEMRQRRPEAEQWRQRHCCWRGCTSGGLRRKWRAGRGRGGDCDAGGGDGTAGRRADAVAGVAGVGRQHGRERRVAGRGGEATGEIGRRLKR